MYFDNKTNPVDGDDITLESIDCKSIIEAIVLESLSSEQLESVCEDAAFSAELVKNDIVMEKTIVRMDKKARLQRALKTATFTIARRKNDSKFKKLLTIWRLERSLEAYLLKKYHNEALRLAKASLNRKPVVPGNGNKAGMVNKAIEKARSQFNSAK